MSHLQMEYAPGFIGGSIGGIKQVSEIIVLEIFIHFIMGFACFTNHPIPEKNKFA